MNVVGISGWSGGGVGEGGGGGIGAGSWEVCGGFGGWGLSALSLWGEEYGHMQWCDRVEAGAGCWGLGG